MGSTWLGRALLALMTMKYLRFKLRLRRLAGFLRKAS